MSAKKIGLVACSKKKLLFLTSVDGTPARTLYWESPLFRKAFTYATKHYDEVYILSAKHGLVDPDQLLMPYDQSLAKMSKAERGKWAFRVIEQLTEVEVLGKGLAEGPIDVYFHAGQIYREMLHTMLLRIYSVRVHVPLRGLQIGEQLRWYNEQVSPRRT